MICLPYFDAVNESTSFLNIVNRQHDNIKFVIEKSTNILQFLDVDIKISENTIDMGLEKAN